MASRLVSGIGITLGLLLTIPGIVLAGTVVLATPLDSVQAASAESTLGDLTADSVLASGSGAQIALVPAAETRPDTVPSGTISTDRLVQNLRANDDPSDTVVVTHLTGAQVINALNHGASRVPNPFDGFLQVSGIQVVYHDGLGGHFVVETVTLASGAPLRPTATYTVAMPRYIANGALGFFSVWPSDLAVKDTGITITDAVRSYAAGHQPLSYQAGSRITHA